MSNADIMVEMIRLAEQIGNVEDAHLYNGNFFTIDGKTKDGKKFGMSLSIKEEDENGN